MNDNLAHLKNEQQPPPGEGQDYAQQETNNNASGATTVPPAAASSTVGMTSQYYPLPPPLDGINTTNFHQEETTTAQGWSSQEGLPPVVVLEQFGSTAAAAAAAEATTVVDYNNDAETHEFLDIPVGNNENDGVDINSLHPPPMMHLPEQYDQPVLQQPQQQHPNEGSSSPRQPVMEGAMMPSLDDQQQQQQQQIPYDFNGNNDDPNSRKRAYHGFASSEGVPEAEQRQQVRQHSPPPPNLPPVTLPPPPPNHHQYPQDNHHHNPPHHQHHQPEQQQLHHPLQNQEQAMNDPNYVHEQQHQPPPPPPIPHHSSYNSHPPPHYPPHPQTQHPHYHPHQYYPSYHQHQQPPPSNHRLGYNTDRPTYLFSLPTTDSQSLSDRQCYIRSTFIELFLATAEDVSSRPAKGSQRIHLNQVGIRCAYCVDNNKDAKQKLLQELQHPRVERAVCFPQSISRIYQTVADMQRRHFEKCARIPVQVMGTYKSLKSTRPRGKGKPQGYWESSAREIGLVDSDMGIRVLKDGEGRMVERFLLQRKKVEEYDGGVAAGGAVVNGSTTDAAQVRAGDYDKKPSAAKRQKTSSGTQVQSPKKQSQTNGGGQRKTISVVVNKIVEPPPVSSYSDAHLLASMRDRASPSLPVVDTAGMINGPDNSHDVHPQLNEEEPMVQHGTMMVENNIHEMHRHQQQQQIPGTYNQDECILGEELTQDLSGGLNMNQDAGRIDIDLQEDGANIGTVPSTENECDYKAVEGV